MSVPYANSSALLRAGKLREGVQRAVGLDREAAGLDVADAAAAVEHERHALGEIPGVVPHAPLARGTAVAVAQELEGQLQLARPRQVALGRVGGDPHDLGVERRELRVVLPEPGEFAVSAAGEGLDVEGDDDPVALLEEVGELEGLALLIDELRVGRGRADLERRLVGRPRRGDGEEGDGEDADGAHHEPAGATARSTASRNCGSGSAPSNPTRSLMTILGTAITRYERERSGNSVASMAVAVTRSDATAMCCARRTARGQYGRVGVEKTLISTSPASVASEDFVSAISDASPLDTAMIESMRLLNS